LKRLKIYVETSVWNFLHADDSPEKRKITEHFFKEIGAGKYEIFISRFVVDEVSRADAEKRYRLESSIGEFKPSLLTPDEAFEALAEKYLGAAFIPERYKTDLFHIVMASVNELDAIVSWNMEHIVKLKTRRYANSINRLEGYREIEIVTPEEVIDYD